MKYIFLLLFPLFAFSYVPSNDVKVDADEIRALNSTYVTLKNDIDMDTNNIFGITNLTVTGLTTLDVFLSGPLKATAGVVSSSAINLTSEVTGVLPIANGGTNSSTALANDKVMVSTTGAIIESATTTTQLGFLDATSSIQNQIDGKVPNTRTLTTTAPLLIDAGATADLSANRVLSMPAAATGTDGYLASTDWNTFNGKEDALPWNANGDMVYFQSAGNIIKIPIGSQYQVLTVGASSNPLWDHLDLANSVSGVLPIANGGTGSATQNFVDITTNQSIAGVKTFTGQYVAVSTTNGMRPCPVMTEAQRDLIGAPAEGDCIINSDTSQLNYYLSASWDIISKTPLTTTGDLLVRGASIDERLAAHATSGFVLTSNGTGVKPTYQAPSGAVFTASTIQKFTSGSGTYTTPASVKYIRVRLVGAGGGGGGAGNGGGGTGGAGNNTTFGTSLLAGNGGGGGAASGTGALGGIASLGVGPLGVAIRGGQGGGYQAKISGAGSGVCLNGGHGGSSPYFSGGGSSAAGGFGSSAGEANTGGGGGGGGDGCIADGDSGAGGGSGGFVDAIINTPLASYSYVVGSGGAGGVAGTSGFAGAAGGSGAIIVEEFYQ